MFSQNHKGSERILLFVMSEGVCITWSETIHHMKLCQLFHSGHIAAMGELFKTGIQAILLRCQQASLIES